MIVIVIYFFFCLFFFLVKGGGFGPYSQSERLLIYQHFVQELEAEGHAYPCFCTDKRLELVKKQAFRDGNIPKYDNRCRHLPLAVVEEKKRQGIPHCIRFKVIGSSVSLEFGNLYSILVFW